MFFVHAVNHYGHGCVAGGWRYAPRHDAKYAPWTMSQWTINNVNLTSTHIVGLRNFCKCMTAIMHIVGGALHHVTLCMALRAQHPLYITPTITGKAHKIIKKTLINLSRSGFEPLTQGFSVLCSTN